MKFDTFVDAWLGGLERDGTLAPGAAAELARLYRGPRAPAALAEEVVAFLAGSDPQRLRFLSPSGPAEAQHHPFAREAALLRPLLTDSGANGLPGRFAVELGGLAFGRDGTPTPGKMAGRMAAALLGNRDDHRFLRPELRPDPPAWETRVRDVLGEFKSVGYIRSEADLDELARSTDFAGLGHKPVHEVRQVVATRLGSGYRGLLPAGVEPPTVSTGDAFYNPNVASRGEADPKAELLASGSARW